MGKAAQVCRFHRGVRGLAEPVGLAESTAFLVDAARGVHGWDERTLAVGIRHTGEVARADALLDLVSRAVGAPQGVPRQAKTSLVVTIGLDVLQGRCRGAGLTMGDEVLTAGTVRRLACDARVVPVVLGTDGEVLDQGVARRLFDRAQIRPVRRPRDPRRRQPTPQRRRCGQRRSCQRWC